MSNHSNSKFGQATAVGEGLMIAAEALAKAAERYFRSAPRPRGATVRPGAATPLWLALAAEVRPHLRPYGAKSLLARELGLDPSRITEFFGRRVAMPDAERTLMLLEWLGRRRRQRIPRERSRIT
ncbi:MAG TPA: hypothetical protein VFJ90_14920 [Candidatus Didemnitutus sp.]|nr:hypothetical protein [Candidatus Didemnitutus sp.]